MGEVLPQPRPLQVAQVAGMETIVRSGSELSLSPRARSDPGKRPLSIGNGSPLAAAEETQTQGTRAKSVLGGNMVIDFKTRPKAATLCTPPSGSSETRPARNVARGGSPGLPTTILATPKNAPKKKKASSSSSSSSSKRKSFFGRKKDEGPESTKGLLLKEIHHFQLENYASKHFEQHRNGPFRRSVTCAERLAYGTDALAHPFLKYSKPELYKEALTCYTRLMYFTQLLATPPGEVSGRSLEGLVAAGIQTPELRDELYLNLVKQLSNNPGSTDLLWKCFALYVQHFPPTKDLEEWLFSFLVERSGFKGNDSEVMHAKFCLQRLPQVCRSGAGGRTPSLSELEQLYQAVFVPGVFARSVRDILAEQTATYPLLKVPFVLHHMAENLKRLSFTSHEGIFRIPGDHDRIFELRLQLDRGQYQLEVLGESDIHTLASLFKSWLRQIPHPLFGKNFVQVVKSSSDVPKSLKIAYSLPDIHREIFFYVIELLQTLLIPEHVAVTKMNLANVAICFAAVLFHCDSSDMNVAVKAATAQAAFLENILSNHVSGRRS